MKTLKHTFNIGITISILKHVALLGLITLLGLMAIIGLANVVALLFRFFAWVSYSLGDAPPKIIFCSMVISIGSYLAAVILEEMKEQYDKELHKKEQQENKIIMEKRRIKKEDTTPKDQEIK